MPGQMKTRCLEMIVGRQPTYQCLVCCRPTPLKMHSPTESRSEHAVRKPESFNAFRHLCLCTFGKRGKAMWRFGTLFRGLYFTSTVVEGWLSALSFLLTAVTKYVPASFSVTSCWCVTAMVVASLPAPLLRYTAK